HAGAGDPGAGGREEKVGARTRREPPDSVRTLRGTNSQPAVRGAASYPSYLLTSNDEAEPQRGSIRRLGMVRLMEPRWGSIGLGVCLGDGVLAAARPTRGFAMQPLRGSPSNMVIRSGSAA